MSRYKTFITALLLFQFSINNYAMKSLRKIKAISDTQNTISTMNTPNSKRIKRLLDEDKREIAKNDTQFSLILTSKDIVTLKRYYKKPISNSEKNFLIEADNIFNGQEKVYKQQIKRLKRNALSIQKRNIPVHEIITKENELQKKNKKIVKEIIKSIEKKEKKEIEPKHIETQSYPKGTLLETPKKKEKALKKKSNLALIKKFKKFKEKRRTVVLNQQKLLKKEKRKIKKEEQLEKKRNEQRLQQQKDYINKLKQENKIYKRQINENTKNQENLIQKINEKTQKIKHAKRYKRSKKKEIKKLKNENEILLTVSELLNRGFENSNKKCIKLENYINTLEQENKKLKIIIDLEKQILNTIEKVQQKNIDDLENENTIIKEDVETFVDLSTERKDHIDKLQDDIDTLSKALLIALEYTE